MNNNKVSAFSVFKAKEKAGFVSENGNESPLRKDFISDIITSNNQNVSSSGTIFVL